MLRQIEREAPREFSDPVPTLIIADGKVGNELVRNFFRSQGYAEMRVHLYPKDIVDDWVFYKPLAAGATILRSSNQSRGLDI